MSNLVTFSDMDQMAGAIAASGLFGMKDKNSVLALMAVAQAEGLHPATAARDFHIIQGRPALKADAMLARFQNAGGKVDWKDYTDEKVTGVFSHPNGGELAVTWTIEQANRIGLVKPGSGWQKFPRAMLRSRCISEGIRSVFPGSVTGFYSPEEVADFEPAKESPKTVTVSTIESIESDEFTVDVEPNTAQITVTSSKGNFSEFVHKLPLYVPGNDQAYATYLSLEDWIDGYIALHTKIMESSLPEKEKHMKCNKLRAANDMFTRTWTGTQTAKFLQKLNSARSN